MNSHARTESHPLGITPALVLITVVLAACVTDDAMPDADDELAEVATTPLLTTPALTLRFARAGQSPNRDNELDGIAVDASGNVYVSGSFIDTLQIAGEPIGLTSAGGRDMFVAKFDARGARQWVKRYGSTGDDLIFDMAVTSDGANVVVSGQFSGTVEFGMNALTSKGHSDAVLIRIATGTGTTGTVKQFGGAGDDGANEIEIDGNGDILMTMMSNSHDLAVGGCTYDASANDRDGDALVVKLGSFLMSPKWAFKTNGITYERARAINVVSSGATVLGYIAGYTSRGSIAFGTTTTYGGTTACSKKSYSVTLSNPYAPWTSRWQASAAFVDVNGVLKWTYQLPTTEGDNAFRASAGDANGKVYLHANAPGRAMLRGALASGALTTSGELTAASEEGGTTNVLARVDAMTGKLDWLDQLESSGVSDDQGGEMEARPDGTIFLSSTKVGAYSLRTKYVASGTGALTATQAPSATVIPTDDSCSFLSVFDALGNFKTYFQPLDCSGATTTGAVVDVNGEQVAYSTRFFDRITYPATANVIGGSSDGTHPYFQTVDSTGTPAASDVDFAFHLLGYTP